MAEELKRESKADWVARNYKNYSADGKHFADKRDTPLPVMPGYFSFYKEQEDAEAAMKEAEKSKETLLTRKEKK